MKHLKKILATALLAITLLTVLPTAMAADSYLITNCAPGTNLVKLHGNKDPNGSYKTQIPCGTIVQGTATTPLNGKNWISTSYNGYSGYVDAYFAVLQSPGDGGGWTYCSGGSPINQGIGSGKYVGNMYSVTTTNVNVRREPCTSAPVVFQAQTNQSYMLRDLRYMPDGYCWYKIATSSGDLWIRGDYLK